MDGRTLSWWSCSDIEPTIVSLDTVGGSWPERCPGVGSRRHSDDSLAGLSGRSEGSMAHLLAVMVSRSVILEW